MTVVQPGLAGTNWPKGEFETLGRCPICDAGASERTLLFDDLADRIFYAAPGIWKLWRCDGCGNAYLDPRPSAASIHLAYRTYYTHQSSDELAALLTPPRSLSAWLRSLIRNDFLWSELGLRLPGGRFPGARSIYRKWPGNKIALLQQFRHTSAPRQAGERLLDIGSGSGAFLKTATALGFRAEGLEPDAVAVRLAVSSGFSVHQGLVPGSGLAPRSYAHITLNHVFEHLHDPIGALAEMFELLVPGGRLWIAQPNLDSIGRRRFGADWRGLEPPRHLTLWSIGGMRTALTDAGFERFQSLTPVPAAHFYFRQSAAIRDRLDPYAPGDPPSWNVDLAASASAADEIATTDPGEGETIYVQAFRPD